jgi:Tol biopolymer transport system component
VEGKVKILDFGLAKAMEPASGPASRADLARSPTIMNSPTLTAVHGTQLGVILGTAAYMAPEQARGGRVDKRADIWAFGVVLYEMLSGRSLFSADTVSDTLAGVLKTEVDFARLPESTPPAIRRLLRRCLERNPKNRLHDIADARIVLDEVASGRIEEGATPRVETVAKRALWPLVAAALVAGLALGALVATFVAAPERGGEPAPRHAELEIAAPAGHAFVSGLALSADGLRLALVARGEDGRSALWVRSLDAPEMTMVAGSTDARYPFWSPDGRQIGFFAQNRLKVSVSGQRSLALSSEGTLVYRADKRNASRLVWANRRGEELGDVGSQRDIWYYGPRLSPDGRRLAVSQYEPGSTSGGIWVHDLGRGVAYPLTSGDGSDDTLAVWSPDGSELAYAAVGGAQTTGIYRIDAREAGSARLWIPGERFKLPSAWLPGGAGFLFQESDPSGGYTLWTIDLEARGPAERLSPQRVSETNAVLSPDGRWLAFGSDATRRLEVYVRRRDDATGASALRVSADGGNFPRWRGDGRELYYVDDNGRMMAVPVALGAQPTIGAPEALFQALLEEAADTQYDVTSDGQRFLLNRTLIEDRVPVSVVLGWPARLDRSVAR